MGIGFSSSRFLYLSKCVVCFAALFALRARSEQGNEARGLLKAVAAVYREDRAIRVQLTRRLEVDGYPAPGRFHMTLESRPPGRLCLTSEPTPEGDRVTMCTDGASVWSTYARGTKPGRRWEAAELVSEPNPVSFLRGQRAPLPRPLGLGRSCRADVGGGEAPAAHPRRPPV